MNFDALLVPADALSVRGDVFYINEHTVLHRETTVNQIDIMTTGAEIFLLCGDVYRMDDIDAAFLL